jgi:sugar phosphate isomerase/epimerase
MGSRQTHETANQKKGHSSMIFKTRHAVVGLVVACSSVVFSWRAAADHKGDASLWQHDNLVAWCVVPFDAQHRGPEERAQMLHQLGFKHFAYDWREKDIPTFDTEIEALRKYGIDLIAWWFPFDADDPVAKQTLETFRRHHVRPQLWVMQSQKGPAEPKNPQQMTREEQRQRVRQEADRIHQLVTLAVPYGSKIELYNHNGWYGLVENELAILARLQELGDTDVGMVYNLSHAHDNDHNDTTKFPALWARMQPHVVAVNITGMGPIDQIIYPSQGSHELNMMRIIEKSGWKGPVGLIAEKGGDARVTLGNYIKGLDWLAAEIRQPNSGGPRPFPPVP